MSTGRRRFSPAALGIAAGLTAAVLFGASTPFAKRLLEDVSPQLLAGLLYAGACAAVTATLPWRRRGREAQLRRQDAGRLALLVAAGGILAPVLLLIGLERMQGTTASLFLNLEGVATLAFGVAIFGEHLSRRAFGGAIAVCIGAAGLTAASGGDIDTVGVLCIVAACACWGLDNNLTQSLTVRDPFAVVAVKTGSATVVNVGLALALGAHVPGAPVLVAAVLLGGISYGASIVLDAYALRFLGAAREAIVFATAPFIGALLAVPLLSEQLTPRDLVAGAIMAVGVGLVVTERHHHVHRHELLEHDHLHMHDEHHRHRHPDGFDAAEAHAHRHRHGRTVHTHPHVSDLHHRHRH